MAAAGTNSRLVLIAENDTAPGGRYEIGPGGATLGRDHERVDVVLGDALVSRVHARIDLGPDGYFIQNLTKTNTVLVNEKEVQRVYLNNGDLVRLGGVELRVRIRRG